MDGHRFNVAIARCMELTNLLRKAFDAGQDVREGAESLVVMLSAFAPYTAEESWNRLWHSNFVAKQSWPTVDPDLLVEESVICVVQVSGKVKARLDVAPDIAEDALREQALADPAIVRALDGVAIRTVIVRAPKLVNIVPS
jgi:leucyl-tRNA synthetase